MKNLRMWIIDVQLLLWLYFWDPPRQLLWKGSCWLKASFLRAKTSCFPFHQSFAFNCQSCLVAIGCIFARKASFYIMSAPITFCGGQWRRKLFCWLRVDGKNNQLLAFIAPEGKYLILTSPQIWPNISSSMKAAFPGVFTIYVNCFCRKMIKCWEPEHKNE